MTPPPDEQPSLFESSGGAPTFARIVDRFYTGVAEDALLRPLYPDDLIESRRTLTLFLIQYFGGPNDYSRERGHPRLRMRHVPFAIGQAERDAWLRHMTVAVRAENLPQPIERALLEYFDRASTFLINN